MVQRKVPNKLVIQADRVKSNTLLANLINKPSSPRGGGPELTKKMKKSRPVKRSSESFRSPPPPPLRKEAAQPGKPPPPLLHPHKPKQSPIKSSQLSSSMSQKQSPAGKLLLEGSPNYMKSTSSFDARKDRSAPRVSPLVHKTPSPKKSDKPKLGSSVSGHKLSRTSSLELVRTLIKTPSFKPSRASKKCSPVALCEEFDVQRATCSSTLKDSKFPNYLELDPGGTELEGTSSMKVCPYTYCSLNGHHHAPLPPLKSFLSARRRMIKTQKSFKLGCLSPCRTGPKETATQQPNFEALEISPASDKHNDFNIEIYSKDGEDGEIVENRDIDFGNLNGNSDAISIELDVGELSPDYWMEGAGEETYPLQPVQDETIFVPDQSYFEASDMVWEIKSVEVDDNIKEVYDEESVGSEAWVEDGDSDVDVCYSHSGSNQFLDLSNNQTSDGHSSMIKETDGSNESSRGESVEEDTIEGTNCEDEFTQEVSTDEDGDEMETDGTDVTESVVEIEPSDSLLEEFIKTDQECAMINQTFTNEGTSSNAQDEITYEGEISDSLEIDHEEANMFKPSNNHNPEDHTESGALKFGEKENSEQGIEDMEDECANNCNGENDCSIAQNKSNAAQKKVFSHVSSTSDEELLNTCTNLRIIRNKKPEEEMDGSKDFNPRDPNFLPLEPDLEGEKVDLRHQMMDERKNAEEWMVDFALQQAVTRLATARKKKVSLLVEAFEKVTPIPKYQTYNRQSPRAFEHTRTIQACS